MKFEAMSEEEKQSWLQQEKEKDRHVAKQAKHLKVLGDSFGSKKVLKMSMKKKGRGGKKKNNKKKKKPEEKKQKTVLLPLPEYMDGWSSAATAATTATTTTATTTAATTTAATAILVDSTREHPCDKQKRLY